MSGFIYKIEKEELEKEIQFKIFSSKDILKERMNYFLYVKEEDFKELNINSNKISIVEKDLKDINLNKVIKIEFENKEIFTFIKEELRERGFKTYEEDIISEHKLIIEKNIKIQKNYKKIEKLKVLSIDIETIGGFENLEIVSVAVHSKEAKKSNLYINKEKIRANFNKKEINFQEIKIPIKIKENEKELLLELKKDIIESESQIIIGWNVIDFDFKVLKERMNFYNIKFKFTNNSESEDKLIIQKEFFKDSRMESSGLLVFDIIKILKNNFIEFEDFKLETVANEVLGEGKLNIKINNQTNKEEKKENKFAEKSEENKLKEIENLVKNNPEKLLEYNFKDAKLVTEIVDKLKLLELIQQRSIITNTPLSKIKSPIASLDIMYLKKSHERGFVANSNFNFSSVNPIEGAFVIEPKKGFYKDIFVLDFKSLYPSIIMTFNIDPFTYEKDNKDIEKIKKVDLIISPNNAKFSKEDGILPEIIKELYQERNKAKEEKNQIKSYAIKTTMNSFYGAMASPKSRFYNKEVAEAITSFGREIILRAKKFVEYKNFKVIYGDTDSIFVEIPKLSNVDLENKKKFGFELENELNEYFRIWTKENFKVESYLNIEFEKLFSKFFIASKKRYVGYDEFTQKNNFVGLEAIRGDWTELAQEFQVKLIEMIFENDKKEKIENFIREYIKELEEGKLDEKLIYKKKITKDLKEYTKTTPPHVKAAREVENFSGRLVKYVMTKNGPKHINKYSGEELDYKHYIDKQLKGVSDDILEEFGISFDEISKKQKSLSSFW